MQETNPKAAVLISTYNRPDYLQEAIQSVVNQEMTDWELLVMNDGGEDVAGIIEGFGDPRIRYFNDTVNKGAAHRFNFGLQNCRAGYVTYLGDDDLFYPNHLAVLSRALDDHPEFALAYSDLYGVSCINDKHTGKRHVLDKKIMVSRDFNRDFMFYYNHVLHVSLMHRKEAAFRVGCFDESVKVLIEWSLNRRLCFYYDFLHVHEATGEYYMPVFKSDRISVVQRKDKKSYRHNTRKIKAYLPPKPWTKVETVDIILPVTLWNESVKKMVGDIVDNIDHPHRILLINNSTLGEDACWAALEELSELGNIVIMTPPWQLNELAAYRYGAKESEARYIYLISFNVDLKAIQKRVFAGLEMLKLGTYKAVKWDVESEKKSNFDIMLERDTFMEYSDPTGCNKTLDARNMPNVAPPSFNFDVFFTDAQRQFSKGNYKQAYALIHRSLAIENGAPRIQFQINLLVKVCLALRLYDEAEREIRRLIERGYTQDNYIRLGQVLQKRGRYEEALEAYQNGMAVFKMTDEDLDSPIFPINFPKELSAFNALMGIAECHEELGQTEQSWRMLHRVSRLRANSHRPFLGFVRHHLKMGNIQEARKIFHEKIAGRGGNKDPEIHRVLGKLSYINGEKELAFRCYLKAYECDKTDEKNVELVFISGAGLKKWQDLKTVFEEYLELFPNDLKGLARLAEIHFHLGDTVRALEIAQKGLELNPDHMILKRLVPRIEAADILEKDHRPMETINISPETVVAGTA